MFDPIIHWHWFALAAILVVVEILAPGVVFLWLGIAAALTGLVVLAFPGLGLALDAIIFAVLAVLSVWIGRKVWRPQTSPTDHPDLNRRGAEHVGKVFALIDDTVSGSGRIHIGDTVWTVRLASGDLAKGQTVRITAVRGAVFEAEPAEPAG